jgi:hypothetical protein
MGAVPEIVISVASPDVIARKLVATGAAAAPTGPFANAVTASMHTARRTSAPLLAVAAGKGLV